MKNNFKRKSHRIEVRNLKKYKKKKKIIINQIKRNKIKEKNF